MRFEFIVPGRPVTWKRTNRVDGRSITPIEQRKVQREIAWCALLARPSAWPLGARYRLLVVVYRVADQGDWDNFGKNISDACEGVLWKNDRQIKDGRCVLEIDRKAPRVEVEVEVIA